MHDLALEGDGGHYTEPWESVTGFHRAVNDVDAEYFRFLAWDPVSASGLDECLTVRI
jgi:hypothetical protein